ncbi:MAG: alkaline phosphatase family protein, partial [Solirubrobacteraceae bacterium]
MPSPAVSRRSGRRRSFAIAAAALAGLLLPSAAAGEVRSGALQGPPGISRSKVLVVGVDGTRWDLVRRLTDEGRLPNLRRMAGDGFAIPSMLQYAPPQAFTMSAVGWSTISSGVWPAKHGVVGLFNDDAAQAGKNGYADFLTRLERVNPAFSTFSVTDWGNLGLHHDGGPIFGDDIDVKHAVSAEDSIPAYEAADAESVRIAGDYLRTGDPDAGFVYLGLVDETGHVVGSTGPAYREAIVLADRRIGHLLRSIDARPTRA